MAPERAHNARVKLNVTNALATAIKNKGLSCETFVDSLGVRIDDKTVFEPDSLVNCGPRLTAENLSPRTLSSWSRLFPKTQSGRI